MTEDFKGKQWRNVATWRATIRRQIGACHVGDSFAHVARYSISKWRGSWRTFRSMPRSVRRAFLKAAIAEHKANRGLYRRVMRG